MTLISKPASNNKPAPYNSPATDTYAARHIAEKFAITITHAQAVVALADLGGRDREVRS